MILTKPFGPVVGYDLEPVNLIFFASNATYKPLCRSVDRSVRRSRFTFSVQTALLLPLLNSLLPQPTSLLPLLNSLLPQPTSLLPLPNSLLPLPNLPLPLPTARDRGCHVYGLVLSLLTQPECVRQNFRYLRDIL